MKLIIRAAVRADLSEIADSVARDKSQRAARFAQELAVRIRMLAESILTRQSV